MDDIATEKEIDFDLDTTQQNISQHIDIICKDGELIPKATNKNFLLVQTESARQERTCRKASYGRKASRIKRHK